MISKILHLLKCPDCDSGLKINSKVFCDDCNRHFYHKENFIDLLPKKPTKIKNSYSRKALAYYQNQFKTHPQKKYSSFDVWGTWEEANLGYRTFLTQERILFEKHHSKSKELFCDISAGSGYYTFYAAKQFKTVLHMDLNLEFLNYAKLNADKKKFKNIFFVRSDYFKPPIVDGVVDTLLCTDSFEYYGPANDTKVIKSLVKKLEAGGVFLFDVHNKKFYFPDKNIFEYTKNDMQRLKKTFPKLKIISFGRVPTFMHPNGKLFNFFSHFSFLPQIRNVCILSK